MLTNRMNENKGDMKSGASDIKSIANEMRNYPEVEDLKTDVGNLKADVAGLASRVKADGSALASKVGQEIEAQASEKYAFLKRESRKQRDRVEAKVHEKTNAKHRYCIWSRYRARIIGPSLNPQFRDTGHEQITSGCRAASYVGSSRGTRTHA